MIDRYNRADHAVDRPEGRPGEFGRAIVEGRRDMSRTRTEALVERTIEALRTVSSPDGGRTGTRTRKF
jgi:hypothetical protein